MILFLSLACFSLYEYSSLRSMCLCACMPCFMLRSMLLHAYMFRSMCLGFYAMSPWFCSSLCFALMLGLYAYMLDIMSMVMPCLDLCVYVLFSMFLAYIYICTCLYSWIHVLPCLCAKLSHVHMCVAMPMSRSRFSHACVLGSMFFTCFTLACHVLVQSMPCLGA